MCASAVLPVWFVHEHCQQSRETRHQTTSQNWKWQHTIVIKNDAFTQHSNQLQASLASPGLLSQTHSLPWLWSNLHASDYTWKMLHCLLAGHDQTKCKHVYTYIHTYMNIYHTCVCVCALYLNISTAPFNAKLLHH